MGMPEPVNSSSLSPARLRLVRVMQWINFGRIENLQIREGDPCFEPRPRVIRTILLGADNSPRCEIRVSHFVLKKQVTELFGVFDRVSNGHIPLLEIKHGLPLRMEVEEPEIPLF